MLSYVPMTTAVSLPFLFNSDWVKVAQPLNETLYIKTCQNPPMLRKSEQRLIIITLNHPASTIWPQLGGMVYAHNPKTQDTEARGLSVQVQARLHRIRYCLKNKL